MKILIKNATIVPVTGEKWFTGDIAIDGGLITAVGGTLENRSYQKVIDAMGCVVMPGFINTHTHAAMTLLRGYADDLPLMQWLNEKIWPFEANLTGEDVYWGTKLAILEMIKSGTTMFADMYFFMDEVAKAVEESGIRACLSRGLIGVAPHGEQSLEESRDFIKNWQGAASGRITTMLGPHAPYTCPPEYLKKVIKMADELGVGMHIHLAETAVEVIDIEKTYGKRPIELMHEVGLFSYPVLGAHLVHLTDAEIDILHDFNVQVAHNPQSNMKLASGIAPVAEMLRKGIKVSLGTDGVSSNNNLDMMEEMRTCSLLHKVSTMDPTVLPASQALEMATYHGAVALGQGNELGQLQVGKKADLILVDFQQPHLFPKHDVNAHLVYSAQSRDVKTVIIDGRIVMEDRKVLTMDEEMILFEVENCTNRLLRKVNGQ